MHAAQRLVSPVRLSILFLATLSCILLPAAPARADGILGAFIGKNFGGTLSDARTDEDDSIMPTVFGGVLGAVGTGLGFEVDFGYTPDFFDTDEFDTKLSVTTLMGNMVVGGGRAHGFAPYASGGVGLIRRSLEGDEDVFENLSTNDFGINVGGGANVMFGTFGIRGDLRYFRSFRKDEEDGLLDIELDDFTFWRATAGAVVRW
jgi:hypothetical protein